MYHIPNHCSWEPFTAPYLEFGLLAPIFISLQLALLFHSLWNEYKHSTSPLIHVTKRTKSILRILFITIQLAGLWWTICDLLPHTPRILSITYYGLYLYQILLRLTLSFKNTIFTVSKLTALSLFLIILIPFIGLPLLILPFHDGVCIWEWRPMDFNQELQFCSSRNIGFSNILIMIGVLWVALVNILLGCIFSFKLKRVLTIRQLNVESNDEVNFKLKSLIIKNYLLTITGSVSTIINGMCWIFISNIRGSIGALFLYMDLCLNCCVLALMLEYNEKYYKRLCRCCVHTCLIDCDKNEYVALGGDDYMVRKSTFVEEYLNDTEDLNVILGDTGLTDCKSLSSPITRDTSQMATVGSGLTEAWTYDDDILIEQSPSPIPRNTSQMATVGSDRSVLTDAKTLGNIDPDKQMPSEPQISPAMKPNGLHVEPKHAYL
eukprot:351217_1